MRKPRQLSGLFFAGYFKLIYEQSNLHTIFIENLDCEPAKANRND